MKNQGIIFDKPFHSVLCDVPPAEKAATGEIKIKTLYSLVSPGTELAIYRGTEGWAPLPFNPGYAAVGEIVELGRETTGLAVGDRVFTYSPHRAWSTIPATEIVLKLPAGIDPKQAVFARIAAVSITALRVSPVELGDCVTVLGMGLVGNLAAQLFTLAGAEVTGVDLCEARLKIARECGIAHTATAGKDLVPAAVVVEATGVPAVALEAAKMTAPGGEVVLLGSPRGTCMTDVTDLLNQVHLWCNGCVTLKGAHEWRYPLKKTGFVKHSLERNCEIILNLIAAGKMKIAPLITAITSPADCQEIYQGFLNHKENYNGVVFDWTNVK